MDTTEGVSCGCECEQNCCLKVNTLLEELKLTEEKYVQILEQIKIKNDEMSKMKEQALVLSGARSMLMKMTRD